MGAAALIMAFSVLVSRFMGLFRDKIISWQFGAGGETDIQARIAAGKAVAAAKKKAAEKDAAQK